LTLFDECNTDVYCTLIFVFSALYLQQSDKESAQQILKKESKEYTTLFFFEFISKEGKKQSCNFTAIQLKNGTAYNLQSFSQ